MLRGLYLFTVLAAAPAVAQTAFFNDPTDTIQVDGQTEVSTACTYEAVVLFPADVGGGGHIYNEWAGFLEDKLLSVSLPGSIFGYNHPVGTILQGDTTIALGVWHHVAFVYDGAQERLYFDGGLVTTRAVSTTIANSPGLAYLGAIPRDGTVLHSTIGYLQSVRLSNVARYAGPTFTPPLGDLTSDANTLLLFNFNEPAGSTTVQDSGPLGRVGTLGVGFPGATPPQLGPVVANEPGSGTPPSVVLHAPTPNPVADVATLRYELAAPVTLRLAVYDALGREVAVPAAGYRPAGAHSASLDVSSWPAGAYVARLRVGGAAVSRPILVTHR
jgi:hypothetical protein